MPEPAFRSPELGLDEQEQASVLNLATLPGSTQPTADELIASLQRNGQDQAILEVALALPHDEYRRVEEVYRRTPHPDKLRRQRR